MSTSARGNRARASRAIARLDRTLAVIVFGGVLVQVYAAGLLWYGASTLHRELGWMVMGVALLHAPISVLARGHGSSWRATLMVAALMVLQPVFVFGLVGVSPVLAAGHALNAGLLLVLSAFTAARATGLTIPTSREPA